MKRPLFDIVPLLPLSPTSRQSYTYRSPPAADLAPGLLVRLPLGRRQTQGLVWQVHRGSTPHLLKTVGKVLSPAPLFTAVELVFLDALRDATLVPLSAIAQSAAHVRLPLTTARAAAAISRTPRPQANLAQKTAAPFRALVSWTPLPDALPHANEGQQLVLVPDLRAAQQVMNILSSRGVAASFFAQTQRVPERRALLSSLVAGETLAVVATRAGIFLPLPRLSSIVVVETALDAHRQWDPHPRYDARVGAYLLASARGVPLTLQSTLPSLDLLALSQLSPEVSTHNSESRVVPERERGDVTFGGPNDSPSAHARGVQSEASAPRTSRSVRQRGRPEHPAQSGEQIPPEGSSTLKAHRWHLLPRSPADPLLLPETLQMVRETLERDGRAFLFHDLAGTERAFACETCRHLLRCEHCGGVLERAPSGRTLSCRQCDAPGGTLPHFCPQCKSPHLRPRSAGTAAVAQTLQREFRNYPLDRLDRETLPRSHRQAALDPAGPNPAAGSRLVLGTERAFAVLPDRAFDTVGVISADRLLEDRSYPAAERFVQLLWRLAAVGREGGRLILQTTHPNLAAVRLAAAGDLAGWAAAERADRAALRYPPAVALLRLERPAPTPARAEQSVRVLLARLSRNRTALAWGYQITSGAGRPRAEVIFRGPLRLLRDAARDVPTGWAVDPHVPLTLLAE